MTHPLLDREGFPKNSLSTINGTPERPSFNVARPPAEEPPTESLFEEYIRTLGRHRVLIGLFALGGITLGLLLGVSSLPVYRTRTSLDIRNLNGDFLDIRTVNPTGNNTAAESDTNLQTQIKLLQSDTLMQAVTDRLMAEPHPDSIERDDLLSKLARLTHVGGNTPIPYKTLVEETAKSIKVKPIGLTRLVEITCDSWDAKFSAKFCNSLNVTFEEQDLQTRAAEAQKTSEWLTRQVADVRQRAEDSEKRLAAAVGGNGLMLSQTTTTPGEQRLRSLQDELVRAEAARMQEEALADSAKGVDPNTLPGVQDNPAHRAYELKLADLRSEIAKLVPPLTELNPKVIHVRSQIAEAEAGLKATEVNSTHRASNEYSAARHREELLRFAYDAQQATVSSDLQKAAQVSLLRRELESEQQLYQTLLQRAKEAGFASAMQASTIRVVDAAKPPKIPFSPQRSITGGAGLVLGALFGTGFAFYRDRNNKVFRGPGEVERYLHVHELGVIPSARRQQRISPASITSISRREPLPGTENQGDAVALTRWGDTFSIAAEAYRNATFSILLSDTSKRSRSYVVTSPNSGEGKTTISSNLGIALSKSKLRTVLIDGDLRRPALHTAFGVDNQTGLRNILRGEVDLEKTPASVLTQRTNMPNIAIIPAGEGDEDVVELLHSSYFGALLARLSKDFDVVLIDTPPILHMADARILAGQSDGAILVFRAGKTTRDQAAAARDLFDHDGVRLVGTILNDFDPQREGSKNYYESYYRYQNQGGGSERVGTRL